MERFARFRVALISILLVVIVFSGIMVWMRYPRSSAIEISIPPLEKAVDEIYIGGAVSIPGIYPLKASDSINTLVHSAGGVAGNPDLYSLKLLVSPTVSSEQPQKIDINRAEAWLLKALPEIGDTRAKAIVDYRNLNGDFKNIYDLTGVEGVSAATLEKIKSLITVGGD